MKLTIRISTSDLKRLEEFGWQESLRFILPVSDNTHAQKIKLLKLWDNPYVYGNPKDAKKNKIEKERLESKIINSDIGDIEIEMPFVYDVKFEVIKIEPDEEKGVR